MKHPITGKAILAYVAVWLFIIILHAGIQYRLLEFPLVICVADAFSYYLLLAGFGFSYYFAVRFFAQGGRITIQEVITHVAGVSTAVFLITMAHDALFKLWEIDEEYAAYLQFSMGWRMASGILLLLLLVLIYYLYNHNQFLRAQQNREQDLKNMLKESEMQMLKFQINPHFIFNSLNSISALTMTSPEQAQEMVIKLSEFFRNALGKERKDLHSLRDEIQQINLYLEIEQIRFGDRLKIISHVPPECMDHKLPALILQPLYENAIKHGIYEHLDAVEIETKTVCKEGFLEVSVSNTFDPMHASMKRGTGIGLKNVRSRLELMYGIPDLVTIEQTRNTYRVKILVPQHHDQNTDH